MQFSIAGHFILFQVGKNSELATFKIGYKILQIMIICFYICISPTSIPIDQV